MRVCAALAAALALFVAPGCRNLDNAQIDVLERDLRRQEDYIWELENYLVEYSDKLRAARLAECRPEPAPSTKAAGSRRTTTPEPTLDEDLPEAPRPPLDEGSAASDSAAPPATGETPSDAPPADAAPLPGPAAEEPEVIDPSEMEAPELEIGPGVSHPAADPAPYLATTPLSAPASDDSGALVLPDPVDYQDQEPAEARVEPTIAAQPGLPELNAPQLAAPQLERPRLTAERLQICRIFGEPVAAEGRSLGSLQVVVEALNATNEPVGAEGEASMMLMLRDAPGSLTRIDRWDFTPEETAAAWQSSRLGDGLHLELPLRHGELPAGELELWARLVTADGRRLLTQIPLDPTQLASLDDATPEPPVDEDRAKAAPLIAAAAPLTRANAEQRGPSEEAKPAPVWRASTASGVLRDQPRTTAREERGWAPASTQGRR